VGDLGARSPVDPQLDSATRLKYAIGGIATGVIHNGLTSYVLLYYNLVLGLSAGLVGTVLAITLVFDAIIDPFIGYWSDNLHSRLGRRHPFMYASLIPVPVLFYLLWNPPLEWIGEGGLFPYLLVVTIALRLLTTCFEVPSNALVPELTANYDERTRLLNYRITGYFISATAMMLALYGYWLRDTPEHPNGLLNAAGYQSMGWVGALVILVTMLISSAGLHRFIPALRAPPPQRELSPRRLYGEFRGAMADASLMALLVAGVFYSAANGTVNALWAYMYSYYWGLSSQQLSMLVVIITVAAPIAMVITPKVNRGRDKPVVARTVLGLTLFMTTLPVNLRTLGFFPANDTPWLFPMLGVFSMLEITLYVMCQIMFAAMLTDLVEKRELVTGMRQEGLLFAIQMFIMKINSGIGLWLAGLALSAIHFPTNSAVEDVPLEAIFRLGIVYGPFMMALYAIAVVALFYYRVRREDHYRHLERLKAGRS
jgi:glycoside/pentoside/hexuronide:cation symporter, GPH family